MISVHSPSSGGSTDEGWLAELPSPEGATPPSAMTDPSSSLFFGEARAEEEEEEEEVSMEKSGKAHSKGEGSGVRRGESAHVVDEASGGGGERIEVPMVIVDASLEAGEEEEVAEEEEGNGGPN